MPSLPAEQPERRTLERGRASEQIWDVAKRLIAHESNADKSSEASGPAVFRVCERLRPHLATLMGNAGFRALLSRALVLASADIPWLRATHVTADGSLKGLDGSRARPDPDEIAEGGLALLVQLLGLLVAFIGEPLTLQLLSETWSTVSINDSNRGKRNQK